MRLRGTGTRGTRPSDYRPSAGPGRLAETLALPYVMFHPPPNFPAKVPVSLNSSALPTKPLKPNFSR
jgi:hypothetical protein